MDRDISIDYLAERLGMGARSFVRRVQAATGHAPGAYLQALRMAAARDMLENDPGGIALAIWRQCHLFPAIPIGEDASAANNRSSARRTGGLHIAAPLGIQPG